MLWSLFTIDCCCGCHFACIILQERQAALAAVSSQLWEGRQRAAATSPQPSAPGRSTPNSPKPQGPALPSIPGPSADTWSAAATHVTASAHGPATQDMSAGAMSAQEGKDKADEQKSFQPQALSLEQKPTCAGTISQEGVSEGHPSHSGRQEGHSEGQVEGRKGPSERKVSERDSRAAARLSRLARNTSNTGSKPSLEIKADHGSQSEDNTGKVLGFSLCFFMNACMSQGMQNHKPIV